MRMSMGLRVGSVSTYIRQSISPELVTNGTFDSDTTGWVANGNVSLSIVSGSLRVESATDAGLAKHATQTISVEIGETYDYTIELVNETETDSILRIGTAENGGQYFENFSVGLHSGQFVATSTTLWITLRIAFDSLSGEGALFDNISIRKVI